MIAFFPGKFQPPHLGHILTIMSVYDDYDKIIVGITEDGPRVTSCEDVMSIFLAVFEHLPKVEVTPIAGVLSTRPTTDGLPEFDVLLTGNPSVREWANKHDLDYRWLDRSCGPGFSGTVIREGIRHSEGNSQ